MMSEKIKTSLFIRFQLLQFPLQSMSLRGFGEGAQHNEKKMHGFLMKKNMVLQDGNKKKICIQNNITI